MMTSESSGISQARGEWIKVLGVDKVLSAEETQSRYAENTLGAHRHLLGALLPETVEQVQFCLRIAQATGVRIYPISTGKNWGYGSALPPVSDCVILDLKGFNRILEVNEELGYVVLEPGVTQKQLYEYLEQRGIALMVPTTGAGPEASILANALEKGYGITPYEDHFGAILSLKAILPTGEIYQSTLNELGGHRVDSIFKWKVGPYIDGLFAQGAFGVVMQASIALARRPENASQFIAFVDEEKFEEAVEAISRIRREFGSVVGGVNLMNRRRVLAMVEMSEEWHSSDCMPEVRLRSLAKKRKLPAWSMLGGLYAPNDRLADIRELIHRELKDIATQILFLDRKRIRFARNWMKFLPITGLKRTLDSMDQALNILEGVPSRVAIPLAYLKNPRRRTSDNLGSAETLSPDKDGCGLIWFSPLLPIDGCLARDFAQELTRVCIHMGVEPLITFTAVSERCFDATIPLVFDRSSPEEVLKARKCYNELIELAKAFGIFPYRLDIDSMRNFIDTQSSQSWEVISQLRKAVDPAGVLSPGRYEKA